MAITKSLREISYRIPDAVNPKKTPTADPSKITFSTIQTIGGLSKKVGEFGGIGIGYADPKYRGTNKATAKFSWQGKAAEEIYSVLNVNALCSENSVYGEYTEDGKTYRFLCTDGEKVEYEGERIHGGMTVLPFLLYALRNDSEITELKDLFIKISKSYKDDGIASMEDMLRFCDTYYYGIAKTAAPEITISEDVAYLMDTVKSAVKSGLLGQMKVLKEIKVPSFTGISLTEQKSSGNYRIPDDEFFAEIKTGKHIVPYANWSEAQKAKIPSLVSLESFVPCKTYFSLVSKIKNKTDRVIERLNSGLTGIEALGKDYVNLFITGKPGTGKTTMAYALGAATGMPVYTVAMTKNTEEDVFQGMNKVVDGSLKFVSTDFLDAYVNGGIIILEEINLPDPSVVMGAIGQAVEYPFILMKDGYIPVKRHPLCIIIGTMNIGTFGSKGVNQALSSRFRQSYILNDPSKQDFINILTSSGAKKKDAGWVFDAYTKITEYLKSPQVNAEDICLNVTLRGCIGALENIAEGEEAKDAIYNTLIGKISEVDLQLAEEVYKEVVMALPDLY